MDLFLLRLSVVYLFVGMCLGVYMGASEDFTLRPVHAHVNLLGWALLSVAGLISRAYPALQNDKAFRAFCWTYNVAFPLGQLALAAMLVSRGNRTSIAASAMEPLAILSALALLAAAVMLFVALGRCRPAR